MADETKAVLSEIFEEFGIESLEATNLETWMAHTIAALRAELADVRKVEAWLRRDAYNKVQVGYNGNMSAYTHTRNGSSSAFATQVESADSLAALGRALEGR